MPAKILRLVASAILLAVCWLAAGPSFAQQAVGIGAAPLPPDQAFRLSAARLDDGSLRLEWTIAKGYYLYRDNFAVRAGAADLRIARFEGDAQSKDDPTFGVTATFQNKVAAQLPSPDTVAGSLQVTYQGCQDAGICYPPTTRQVDLATLAISDPGKRGTGIIGQGWTEPAPAASASSVAIADDSGGMVADLVKDGGLPLLIASFLLSGVALAFTPCVFPMYPILAGTIARQGEKVTVLKGFTLSLAYVLAMAGAFGLLGVVAAWSGQNLQMALQSPLTVGAVSVLFVALALSMFGLFELQLPASWVNAVGRAGSGTRGSHLSAAVLGFTSVLIVGPCVTAPLAGALLYIAQTGDVALGAGALFALGIGKGIPLVAFGTFGPKALPKAGAWMTSVRQAFGFVFLAAAVWMLSRLVAPAAALALWALVALGVAAWLGAFDTLAAEASGRRRAAKAIGLASALYGVMLAVGAASGAGDPLRPLGAIMAPRQGAPAGGLSFRTAGEASELRQSMAEANGKPSLLYVTADWCVTCAVIDRTVLGDPAVRALLSGFNLVKLDVSDNTPAQREIMQSLKVVGPPTMMFVDAAGREAEGTRLVGEVTRATLEASARRVEASR